jgi:ATP-dependent Clp protease ATP-binding subunit ClpC
MEEARHLHHRQVGTSHLLVGILAVETTAGSSILRNMGVTLASARTALSGLGAEGGASQPEEITETAQRVLEVASDANQPDGDGSVGTEALVMGLLESGDGPTPYDRAASLLAGLGVTTEKIEAELEKRRRLSAERIDH